MESLPEPEWPVVALAAISLFDAIICLGPVPFVRNCLEAVHFPRRYWGLLTPIKVAAAAGLVLGVWVPYLAFVTCVALVAYFVIAISMHVRARDFTSRLFVNATGMLVLSLAVGYVCL